MQSGTDLTLNNMTNKGLLQLDILPNLLTYLNCPNQFIFRNQEEILNDDIAKLKPFAEIYISLMHIQLPTASAKSHDAKTQLRTIPHALKECDPLLADEIERQLAERKISEAVNKLDYYKKIIRARCEQLEHIALICATWGLFISEKEKLADSNPTLKAKQNITLRTLLTHFSNLNTKFNVYPFSDKKDVNLTLNKSLISLSETANKSFVKWSNTITPNKPGEEFKEAASSPSTSTHSQEDSKSEAKRDPEKPPTDDSLLNTTEEFTRRSRLQRRARLKVKGILIGGALAAIPPVALAIAWTTNPILAFGYTLLTMLVGAIVGGAIDNCHRDDSLPAGAKRRSSDPTEGSKASPPSENSSLRTQRALAASNPKLSKRPVTSSSTSAAAARSSGGEAKRQGGSSLSGSMQQTLSAADHRGDQIAQLGNGAADMAGLSVGFAAGAAKLREKQSRSWF